EGMTGTAADNIDAAFRTLDSLRADGDRLLKRLAELGSSRGEIKLLYDRLTMEIDMVEADEKLANTASAFALTGWAPEPDVPALEKLLGEYCCAYDLSDPEPDDKVPIKLRSNALTEPLNMVTEMYSLPDYRGVDPNPLIAPFFCIFFGMMFNDLGYGLVFIAASLIIRSKVRLRGTMKYMMGLMLMCGVTTAVMGLITGSFFGDSITVIASMFGREVTLPSLLDPLSDPMKVLIISIAFGAVHIIFGMAVKAYMLIRDGHPLDALFDVGSWWLLFAGIAVLATGGTYWIAVAGVAALVLTQGRAKPTLVGKLIGGLAGLYDITSYLSDVLSYSRIMALMLAGGIVASIVNILGSLPGTIILFIPIFIIGHVFNIGINVIGTYVHAARLQYLEFFGKFYMDGGRPFRPLGIKTKYYDIVEEDQA
ncbi:MAG: V-type ATP synthase subunit I, partial [Oscillospiraceae bacterium]|nr:V-type ATP synthase subunit I [Oscillospiraceae bacterium]